jgi:hypothetical protein
MLTTCTRLGIALLCASVLAGSRDASAAVGDPDTVTCAYPVWVGFGPVHLANELGYFQDEGITVEEILDDDMPNALAAMEGVTSTATYVRSASIRGSGGVRTPRASSSARLISRPAATAGRPISRSSRSATSRARTSRSSRTCRPAC